MSQQTKPKQADLIPTLNPLDAWTVAIEALIDLATVGDDDTRLAAADLLLANTACPPNINWDFELDPDE